MPAYIAAPAGLAGRLRRAPLARRAQVREVDMLLVMPTFDQAAKDKELGALVQTITSVMSDGILLTKRKFDDDALTKAQPASNPKLRQEIAQLQRDAAAMRIQATMRVRRAHDAPCPLRAAVRAAEGWRLWRERAVCWAGGSAGVVAVDGAGALLRRQKSVGTESVGAARSGWRLRR